MSNTKLSAGEIVELMIKDRMISRKSAEEFVKVFFSVIEDALIDGETVKIKGLGTFKSQWNEARKSVNVNTGEEILIEGFYRAAFIPENELRELINEPFSHLEPVELDPLPENKTEQKVGNEEDEDQNDIIEPLEPLRVFEEQAEEIKELLSEINALSPEKVKLSEIESDKVKQEAANPEDTNVEVSKEGTAQADEATEEISEKTETTDERNEVTKPDNIEQKISEFDFEGFDIIRDISARFTEVDAVSFFADLKQEESSEPSVETESIPEIINVENEAEISEDYYAEENPETIKEDETDDDVVDDEDEAADADDDDDDDNDNSVEQMDGELTKAIDEKEEEYENNEEEISVAENLAYENTQEVAEKKTIASNQPLEETPVEAKEPEAYTEKKIIESASKTPQRRKRTYREPEKKKRPVWLFTVLGVIALAAVLLVAVLFVKKNLDQQKNKMYMEYLADSTVRALQVQKAEDSLSLAGDSLQTTDTATAKNPEQPPMVDTAKVTASGKVFDAPRSYTQLITTEKMVAGSQLTKFARQYYGHPHFWVYIYEANRDVIKDPNNVPLGISVKIPKLDARLVDPKSKESLNFALKLQAEYLK